MNRNILVTVVTAIVLGLGAFLWIWNSELQPATTFENVPPPQATTQN